MIVVALLGINTWAHLKSGISLARVGACVSKLLQLLSGRNRHQKCSSAAALAFSKVSASLLISISQTIAAIVRPPPSLGAFITRFSILGELLIACFKGSESLR